MARAVGRARRSGAQWQSLIERAERSPLSVEAFCRGEGVSTASFYQWRKRLDAEGASREVVRGKPSEALQERFIDLGALGLAASDEAAGLPWQIELELGAGVVLRLRQG